MVETSEIRKLRQAVINAKLNCDEAIYMLKRAETLAILLFVDADPDGWKGLGPNEEARKLTSMRRQDLDPGCQRHRGDVRDAERTLAEAEADVEAWLDVRRREREAVGRALADALALGGVIPDSIEAQVVQRVEDQAGQSVANLGEIDRELRSRFK